MLNREGEHLSKVALITGITRQGGSSLSELALEKGYKVHGIKRRASLINTERIDHLKLDAPRKLLDVTRIRDLNWRANIPLKQGVDSTDKWYVEISGHQHQCEPSYVGRNL